VDHRLWEIWSGHARSLAAFHAAHGRLPRSAERTPDGYPIGKWLSEQRFEARGKNGFQMDPRRRAWLDEHLPGWDGASTWRADRWHSMAQAIKEYVAEHGHFPSRWAAAPDGRNMRNWLQAQRGRANGAGVRALPPEQRAWLDENLPGWRGAQ